MLNKDNYHQIAQAFTEGTQRAPQGDSPIIGNANGKDCFIVDIPEKESKLFKANFYLDDQEKILLARDTSAWNNRREGLVITDKRIVYIPGKRDPHNNRYVVDFGAFIRVTYDAENLLFWGCEENFITIPKKFFFKAKLKSYNADRAIQLLSKLLTKIAIQNGGGDDEA